MWILALEFIHEEPLEMGGMTELIKAGERHLRRSSWHWERLAEYSRGALVVRKARLP